MEIVDAVTLFHATITNQIKSNTVTLLKIWVADLVARCLDKVERRKPVKYILDDAFLVVIMPSRIQSGVINRTVMRCYRAVLKTYYIDKNR